MSNKSFNLDQCIKGLPVKTISGMEAKFIGIDKENQYKVPCPLTMEVLGKLESYTKEGKHLFDAKLDLYTPDPIDWNINPVQ